MTKAPHSRTGPGGGSPADVAPGGVIRDGLAPDAAASPAADPAGEDLLEPETARPEPVQLPRLGVVGWIRWAWRQLTSMRTALLLLMLLAVAAVPGSVLPQNRVDPGRVQQYLADHTKLGPVLRRLGMFDVYASPWFSAVYLLLFVSLIGCVIPRTRQHWRAMRARPPRTPRRLDRMPEHEVRTVAAAPDQALAAARTALRRHRYRIADDEGGVADDEGSVAAERGYLAETGNLVFHVALVLLLVAVAAGSLYGYSGQAIVVEGEQFADTLPRYDSFSAGPRVDSGNLPPFWFRLNAMHVRFEEGAVGSQFGAPRSFGADLTVKDSPDAAEHTQTVEVNEPLDVNGTRVFLSGNGYAPVITVKDGTGNVVKSGPVVFLPRDGNYTSLGVVKVSDARPRQLGLRGFFLPTAVFDPMMGPISIFPDAKKPLLVLTAYVSRPGEDGLGVNSGAPQSVYVLNTGKMTQLTGADGEPLKLELSVGQSVQLPDGAGSVTFEGIRRYASFDIRYDPSKLWALLSSLLALAGLTASLFVRRRRVWVRVSAGPSGGSRVEIAGLARGEDAGLAMELVSLLDAVGPAGEDVQGSAGDSASGGAAPHQVASPGRAPAAVPAPAPIDAPSTETARRTNEE
ncbi:MAG TPA: cytochrome c biogenesis protein ResB [Kineosporiaceae bacterium]|nr:cytochrome c biogenesis protein ResB [Kineosporiaceae bacterium]